MAVYIGIDPSMSGMGLAFVKDGSLRGLRLLTTKPNISGLGTTAACSVLRIRDMCSFLYGWLDDLSPDIVSVEEHTYNPKNRKSITSLGMLQYAVLSTLLDIHGEFEVLLVRPKVRAKFATGNGNSDKAQVVEAVNERWLKRRITNDNVCDAIVLAYLAKDYRENGGFDFSVTAVNKGNRFGGVYYHKDFDVSLLGRDHVKDFVFSSE